MRSATPAELSTGKRTVRDPSYKKLHTFYTFWSPSADDRESLPPLNRQSTARGPRRARHNKTVAYIMLDSLCP